REICGTQRAENRQRHLGTDALDGLQQSEPFALKIGEKPEQTNLVLAHVRFDSERHRLSLRRHCLQRARRTMDLVADAVHIDDDEVLAVSVDHAFELADHRSAAFTTALWR